MVHIHERMADNGIQFAATLLQMNEELLEAAGNAERNRKVWKANGLAAEQKVVDLEAAMRKSKAKYDSLAEEYDRARTGESRPGGGKVLGAFKAHKSAAQQEEDGDEEWRWRWGGNLVWGFGGMFGFQWLSLGGWCC